MAYTSEIEKLERRFAENPAGRNFAPLADAYRKAGELDRAIELCKSGLDRHPDYVSAHIVYGRCLIDRKDDASAEQVFQKILVLDPENIIGLKVLAEIAERGNRHEEGVKWLTKLLAADPMNGDAAEALARAKSRAAVAAKTVAPAPEVVETQPGGLTFETASLTEGTTAAMAQPDFSAQPSPLAPPPPPPAAEASSGIEVFDGTLDFNEVAPVASKAEGLELQEEAEIKPQQLEVEGLARTQYESGMFFAPAVGEELAAAEEELPSVDLPLIMPEDVEPTSAARAPVSAAPPPPPSPPPPPPPPVPAPSPPAAVALSDDDGAADTAALSEAEPVLTETMAELYLKQGHQEDALRVYQALLAQRPRDARLRTKVETLSGRGQGGGAPSGQSVRAYLRSILVGRSAVAPPAAAESPGMPARAADEGLSLDAVFGEEGGRPFAPALGGGSSSAPPPGEPAPAAPAKGAEGGGGFSFDDFFGSPSKATSALRPPAGPPGPPGPPAPGRPLAEEEGDLDQFQAWLKGLKS